MSLNSFDDEIRSKLYVAETDVPDHLWSAVASNLAPQKKRRWWFWLIIPLMVGVSFGVLTMMQPKDGPLKGTKIIGQLQPSSRESPISSTEEPTKLISAVPKIGPEAENKKSLVTESDNTFRSFSTRNPTPTRRTSNAIASTKGSLEADTNGFRLSAEKNGETSRAYPNNLEAPEFSLLSQTKGRAQIGQIDPLLTISSSYFKGPDPSLKICPSFSRPSALKPFVEFSIGAGLPLRTLEERNQEIMGYKDNREETEKVRSSLAVQGLVGVEIREQFEIKAGLGLSKIFEVFDYVDETASRTTTDITIITDPNTGVTRTDTSITTEYGQRIKLSQNRYTFLNAPLLAAYKFKVRDHQFFVQGGAVVNLALKTRGDIRSPEDMIQSIDSDDNESPRVFRKNTGIDLTGSIGYEWEMSERSFLRFSATYRHALNDLTIAGYPLGQRYKHIHLGVSLKHNLK